MSTRISQRKGNVFFNIMSYHISPTLAMICSLWATGCNPQIYVQVLESLTSKVENGRGEIPW